VIVSTGPSLQLTLQHALALHRQGQVAAAERLYQQILELSPGHADALQLVGAIRLGQGNNEAAVQHGMIVASPAKDLGEALIVRGLVIGLRRQARP
jgi:Flp pilus assembly protein TadD